MALIDDPILNSPFREPGRHFKFDDEGITNEILNGRRPSSHFVPVPRAKKKGKQLQFDTEWTKDRIEPNPVVDRIRQRVGAWRQGGYVGVTGTSSRLLAYWTRDPNRECPDRRRAQHPYVGRSEAPPRERSCVPAGQADARKVLPAG